MDSDVNQEKEVGALMDLRAAGLLGWAVVNPGHRAFEGVLKTETGT